MAGSPATITAMTATALARAIAAGELTASEAVEAHIARIEQVNGELNAVVVRRYQAARALEQAARQRPDFPQTPLLPAAVPAAG